MKKIRLREKQRREIDQATDTALELLDAVDEGMDSPEGNALGLTYANYFRATAELYALYAKRLEERAKPAPIVSVDRTVN